MIVKAFFFALVYFIIHLISAENLGVIAGVVYHSGEPLMGDAAMGVPSRLIRTRYPHLRRSSLETPGDGGLVEPKIVPSAHHVGKNSPVYPKVICSGSDVPSVRITKNLYPIGALLGTSPSIITGLPSRSVNSRSDE